MARPRRLVDDATAFGRRAVRSWQRRRGTTPPEPDRTGFYAAVDPGPGPRGEVLGTEAITVGDGAAGWRVRYRTVDAAGRPVAATMAIAVPAGLAPAPRPIVVWVHGAGGVAPGCGPSRSGLEAWYAADVLHRGAVVVAPDLTGLGMEGPLHAYLHGTTAGHSVLDAARAAAALPAAGAGPTIAIAGHSAGGHAVLWANELARDADDLDVRLVVPMSPVADLASAMAHYATGHGNAAFPVQLAATWPAVEPVVAADVLTTAALDRIEHLRTDRLGHLVQVFDGAADRWVDAAGFTTGAWAEALARQAAGRTDGAADVLLVHGDDDEAVPVAWTRTLAADLDAGSDHRVELLTYPGADHMGVHDAARDDVVARLLAALDLP